jgi:excinuclease ABC subunit A
MGELQPAYFSFNERESACPTCLGLGTYLQVHPDLLVPDKQRSITRGAFVPEAFTYDKNSWNSRMVYSLAHAYGFSLDTPFGELPTEIVDLLFYGTRGEKIPMLRPEGGHTRRREPGQTVLLRWHHHDH